MAQKRPSSLNELVYLDTKDFLAALTTHYLPSFQRYKQQIYNNLITCYETHIIPLDIHKVSTAENIDSQAMLDYYGCYKSVLRKTREQNKELYEKGLYFEKKLKHCIEIKSNTTQSVFEFQGRHEECLETYRERYQELYSQVFAQRKDIQEPTK